MELIIGQFYMRFLSLECLKELTNRYVTRSPGSHVWNSGKTRNMCHLFKLKLLERKTQEALRTRVELPQGQKVWYIVRDHQCWPQVVPWFPGDCRLPLKGSLRSLPASDVWHCVAL